MGIKIDKIKEESKSIVIAVTKTVFKIGLITTGVATFYIGWLHTPYGSAPIVQVFGTLNIIIALGWEYLTQKSPAKKQIKK